MKKKAPIPYDRLKEEICRNAPQPGMKHRVFLGLTGDMKPAFCVQCGAWSNDVPSEAYENL